MKVKTNVKAGPGSGAGGVWLNHNETIVVDEEAKIQQLTDLEPQGDVLGGTGQPISLLRNGQATAQAPIVRAPAAGQILGQARDIT
ncbi:MAG: hypothetical protein M3X11_04515 [Acidobacteriota bacterium]|nr:hypothetical protein [Acidobacteriota bacterium]